MEGNKGEDEARGNTQTGLLKGGHSVGIRRKTPQHISNIIVTSPTENTWEKGGRCRGGEVSR